MLVFVLKSTKTRSFVEGVPIAIGADYMLGPANFDSSYLLNQLVNSTESAN